MRAITLFESRHRRARDGTHNLPAKHLEEDSFSAAVDQRKTEAAINPFLCNIVFCFKVMRLINRHIETIKTKLFYRLDLLFN